MAIYREPFKARYRGSKFGASEDFRNGGKHRGQDYTAPAGSRVKAVATGFIIDNFYSEALGNCIIQDASDDKFILYAHLAKKPKLKIGDLVIVGRTLIGKVGNTGTQTTGAHLHVSIAKKPLVHLCDYKYLIDPLIHFITHAKG
jgi:murein DD-endopeptidase MepM/ murein hydrolase activator NlpD